MKKLLSILFLLISFVGYSQRVDTLTNFGFSAPLYESRNVINIPYGSDTSLSSQYKAKLTPGSFRWDTQLNKRWVWFNNAWHIDSTSASGGSTDSSIFATRYWVQNTGISGSAPIGYSNGLISLNTSGISAGTYNYGNGSITFDAYGRATAATSSTGSIIQNLYPQNGLTAINDSTFEWKGMLLHHDTISGKANQFKIVFDSLAGFFLTHGSLVYKSKTINDQNVFADSAGQLHTDSLSGSVNVQFFNVAGTYWWYKPKGAKTAILEMQAPGGGAGSGRKGAPNTDAYGGGGAAGGGYGRWEIDCTDLPDSVSITVGTPGTGGPGQTTNSTNGNNGTDATNCTFGNPAIWTSFGGQHGSGGTITNGINGNGNGNGFTKSGQTGGAGSNTSGIGPGNFDWGATGGSGGGGVNAANVAGGYALGGAYGGWTSPLNNYHTGFVEAQAGQKIPGLPWSYSGNSSAGQLTGNSLAGSNGAPYGGGGSGSGAVRDNQGNSGKGGDGGGGFIKITTFK